MLQFFLLFLEYRHGEIVADSSVMDNGRRCYPTN
jgi:hypothetical protein